MRKYLFYISQLYGFAIVRPIQDVIVSRGDEVAWFFDNPKKLLPNLRPSEKFLKSVADVKAYNPCAVFVPGNVVPDFFPGVKVELFHGFHARKRSDERGHFRIRNFFDLYCTQGPDTTLPFQELEKIHGFFEVVETGWPKMDPLFDTYTQSTPKKNRSVILLTSTFTPRLSGALELFETVKQIAETGTWKWLVNFHPKMAPEVIQKYKSIQSENLIFVETDDIIPLLKAADVMVSDTSSIISEFLLQNKPVVTYKNRVPGPQLLNITEPHKLKDSIEYALARPESLMKEIKGYSDNIHPYRDGRSSIRVLEAADRFVAKGRDHLKPKPFNLLRSLKVRSQLMRCRF
ncbi:MAG: CDP-glycerol glycerophosphotransferase family protein [Desulfobacteraceae bacterium]|nr:CDP-glycerol glycerophosphotransferase family protein [Desulfobacteraceae bacterium]